MVHFIRFSVGNAEVIQIFFHRVLRCQAGVHQETLFVFPAGQAAIVVEPEFVRDDEGDDSIVQAFLEQDQPSDAAISVLKGWMDSKSAWKDTSVSSVFSCSLYFVSNLAISALTFSGGVVT